MTVSVDPHIIKTFSDLSLTHRTTFCYIILFGVCVGKVTVLYD